MEVVTKVYNFVRQEIVAPLKKNTNATVDLLVSTQSAKLASKYPYRPCFAGFLLKSIDKPRCAGCT